MTEDFTGKWKTKGAERTPVISRQTFFRLRTVTSKEAQLCLKRGNELINLAVIYMSTYNNRTLKYIK